MTCSLIDIGLLVFFVLFGLGVFLYLILKALVPPINIIGVTQVEHT